MPKMVGTIVSTINARRQFVRSKMIALPNSMTIAFTSCSSPLPVKVRTVSTSLVTRVINCPVCAWS